jgi:hypothetical protein
MFEPMGDLELIIAELERKKEHIQRAIDELRKAETAKTPEDMRGLLQSEAVHTRRSRASRKGWERRRAAPAGEAQPGGGAHAA